MAVEKGQRRRRGAQPKGSYDLTTEQVEELRQFGEPITVACVAAILGQSEASLYNAIAAGRLRAVEYRWNERTMYKLQARDVIEWAKSRPQRKKRTT